MNRREEIDRSFHEEENKSFIEKIGKKKFFAILSGAGLLLLILIMPKPGNNQKEKINSEKKEKIKTERNVLDDQYNMEKVEKRETGLSQEQKIAIREEFERLNEAKGERRGMQKSENIMRGQNTRDVTGSSSMNRNRMPVKREYKYELPNRIKRRLDDNYQSMVSFFRKNTGSSWEMSKGEYSSLKKRDLTNKVKDPLKNLYQTDMSNSVGTIELGSGKRIYAITDQKVNSDHPGLFTCRVIRPREIKGAKLLLKSGSNMKGRIPCQVVKMIYKGNESQLSGQVDQGGSPGISGKVHNNWYKRLGPSIINAGIGGSFLAWQMQNDVDSIRIDSRDQVLGPIVQQSVQGLQDEINRMGGDYPNTVIVEKGTPVSVLLENSVEMQI